MRGRLVFALVPAVMLGCIRRAPEVSVLAPFGESVGYGVLDDTAHFRYIEFRDDLTASVFSRLARSRVYEIAPAGTPLLCPSNPSPGMHGFVLQTQVVKLMGDSALAAMKWACHRPNQSLEQAVLYMLRHRSGKWQIDRAIQGAISVEAGLTLPSSAGSPRNESPLGR